jgi:hypothetical protein
MKKPITFDGRDFLYEIKAHDCGDDDTSFDSNLGQVLRVWLNLMRILGIPHLG